VKSRFFSLLLLPLLSCGGMEIPDQGLTPCQRATVERILACQKDPNSGDCADARERESKACAPLPGPTPEPLPGPTPEPSPEPTPEPSPEPSPPPTPEPTPEPSPLPGRPNIQWKLTDASDVCLLAQVEGNPNLGIPPTAAPAPQFIFDVEAVTAAHPPLPGDTEATWYSRLAPFFWERGLDVALYGEELAVSKDGRTSENYDRLLSNGDPRTGPKTFRSRCFPATLSEVLPLRPYPTTVDSIRIKKFGEWLDGVALHRNFPPDPNFPPDRAFVPTCGPEGPGREECDKALPVRWEGNGRVNVTNPWLFKPSGGRVRACVGSVCSDWLEP